MAHWRNVTRIHSAVYRWTNGRLGARLAGIPMLLLTTVGRTSGRRRTLPLAYLGDGEDFVVVASNGGQEVDPAWWRNLQQNPEAEVQVGRETFRARARVAEGEERDRLFRAQADRMPNFDEYATKTDRVIPVVVLERIG